MKKNMQSFLADLEAFSTPAAQNIIKEEKTMKENNMIYIAGRGLVKDDINPAEYADEYETLAETAEYVYFMQDDLINAEEPTEAADSGITEAEEPAIETIEESEIFTEPSLNNFQYSLDKNIPAGSIQFYGSVIASEADRIYANILRILEIDRIDMDGYAVERYNAIVEAIERSGKADYIEQNYANYMTAVFSLLKIEEDRFFAPGYFRGIYKCYFDFAAKQKYGIIFAGYADLNEKFYSLYNSYYSNSYNTETEESVEEEEEDYIEDDFIEETEEEYFEEPTEDIEQPTELITEAVLPEAAEQPAPAEVMPEAENICDNEEPAAEESTTALQIAEEEPSINVPAEATVNVTPEVINDMDMFELFLSEHNEFKTILDEINSNYSFMVCKINYIVEHASEFRGKKYLRKTSTSFIEAFKEGLNKLLRYTKSIKESLIYTIKLGRLDMIDSYYKEFEDCAYQFRLGLDAVTEAKAVYSGATGTIEFNAI